MGGEVSTDFKSANRIEISRLVQVLLNFDWFQGSPTLGGGGVGGWGWGVVTGSPLHTCTCTHVHACTHTHTHVWHHRESLGFPQIQWGQPFAWNYHVYHACMCVHVCGCVRVHVHMCGGHPSTIHHPHPPSPPTPRATGSPKHQNLISLGTNRDNSILFEDSLPLNIP